MKAIIQYILQILTRNILEKYNPDIVGITGSVGKTTTKELAYQILKQKFRVRANQGSFNTELGLPLTVIGCDNPKKSVFGWLGVIGRGIHLLIHKREDYPEILVLEMGADRPGDIQYLTRMAPCTVGVVTAVAPAHLAFFKTVKKIIREKRIMVSHLDKNGYAILNRDIDDVYAMREKTDADVTSFGFNPEATVRGSDMQIKFSPEGWAQGVFFKVLYKGSTVPIYIPGVIGEPVVYAALAAAAIALAFDLHLVDISHALSQSTTPPGRMRLLPGIKDTYIVDDTYNASPTAMRAALEAFTSLPVYGTGERYVVLGDMLELGTHTDEAHREIGLRVAECGVDYFITVGPAMKKAATAAHEAGIEEHRISSFANSIDAGKFLQEKIHSGDLILVKGSRGMKTDVIVKEIMAEPLQAGSLLAH